MAVETFLLRDIQMPTGMPTRIAMTTAKKMTMRVSMLLDQSPVQPKTSSAPATISVDRRPATA